MSLVNQISNIIALPVGKLASWIEQTYNIQSTDVIEQWNVISGMDMNEKAKPRARSQRTKKQCEYIFSGERAGEQCDVTPKSGVYCSKHTPKDKTVTKAKSSAKKATTEISKDFGSDDDIASTKPKTVKNPKAKKEESDDDEVDVVIPKPKTVKKPKAKKEESDDDEIDVVVTPKPKITIKNPKAKKNESDIEQHPTTEPNVVTEDEDEEPNIPTKPLLKSRKVLSVDKLDNGINVSSDED
jgi:hypothetical protein